MFSFLSTYGLWILLIGGMLFMHLGHRGHGGGHGDAWTLLTPVFGVVFGWLLLGDGLSGQRAVGVGLVLVARPLTVLPGRERRGSQKRVSLPDSARAAVLTGAPPSVDVLVQKAG